MYVFVHMEASEVYLSFCSREHHILMLLKFKVCFYNVLQPCVTSVLFLYVLRPVLPVFCCVCVTGCVLPGAGAFEIAAYQELMKYKDQVKGRARLGQFAHSIVVVCQNFAHVSCGNVSEVCGQMINGSEDTVPHLMTYSVYDNMFFPLHEPLCDAMIGIGMAN